MRFIGIDLAWSLRKTHHPETAAVVIDSEAAVIASAHLTTDAAILDFVFAHCGADGCLIGIDAPLVVPNDTGRRACEAQLQEQAGIPAYPANRSNFARMFGGVRGETLTALLAEYGFALASAVSPSLSSRATLEVYPRAFIRRTWGAIPPYKGTGERPTLLRGLRSLQQLLLTDLDPPLRWEAPPVPLEGWPLLAPRELKRQGDLLDAAISAYMVYLAWRWGAQAVEVFGDVEHGFIITPRSGWHVPSIVATEVAAMVAPPAFDGEAVSHRATRPRDGARRVLGRASRACLCGCGGMTRGGRFLPGHDAKLKGLLLRRIASNDQAAMEELAALGWGHFAKETPSPRPK